MRKRIRLERARKLENALVDAYRSGGSEESTSSDRRERLRLRIARARARVDRLREQLQALDDACRAMVIEQGLIPCDWCGSLASHIWELTPKEFKAGTRKAQGRKLEPLKVNHRCANHLPHFYPAWFERYQPFSQAPVSLPMAA